MAAVIEARASTESYGATRALDAALAARCSGAVACDRSNIDLWLGLAAAGLVYAAARMRGRRDDA